MNIRIKNTAIYVIVFYLALECIAHVDSFIKTHITRPPFASIQIQDSLGVKGRKYGSWRDVRLNKYGFNDSDDYDRDTKTKAVRIMCLGDSIGFGTTTEPNNWPNFLEEMLRSKEIDVEVINTSMPGNSYSEILKRFEADYIGFKPDILLIYKGFRSYMAEPTPIVEKKQIIRTPCLIKSYLYKEAVDLYKVLLERRKEMGTRNLVEGITEENLMQYEKDVSHLIEICKANNITLILTPFPTLVNEINKDKYMDEIYKALYYYPAISEDAYIKGVPMFNLITLDLAKKENLTYVDIRQGLERTKEYFNDNYHLTIKGAKQVAKNYADALIQLIDPKLENNSKQCINKRY